MNDKEYTNIFGTMETKRVLKVDYPIESSSTRVPIPIRKNGDLNSLQDDGFELFDTTNDRIQDPMLVNNADQNLFTNNYTGWIEGSDEMSFIKMDEDIFQVDQSDSLPVQTFAELNAYGESLLEDFNSDNQLIPLDSKISELQDTVRLMSSYLTDHVVDTSPVNQPSSSKSGFQLSPSSFGSQSSLSPDPTNSIPLEELLNKETKSQKCLSPPILGTSVSGSGFMLASESRENFSSSAPTYLGLDQIWQLREPRQHLLSTGSLAEEGSTSSLSTGWLAKLNSYGGESLLEDFNSDNQLIPLDSKTSELHNTVQLKSSYLIDHVMDTSPVNRPSSSKSGFQLSSKSFGSQSSLSPDPTNSKPLEKLLNKETKSQKCLSPPILGTSVPGSGFTLASKSRENLSSSAPTYLGLDQIWQRREPRQHLLSTGSLAEAESTSSLSTGGVLTPEANDFSLDEAINVSDDDTELEEICLSDNDSGDVDCGGTSAKSSLHKDRYFWLYNVESKGPRSQRLVSKCKLNDPHCLNKVIDPVFSPNCPIQGIKHSGKPRKGNGNDLTPNPKKLLSIGRELKKLNKSITEITPISELPFNVRENTCKEKNKLVSRACRLKKKAQHEANKIQIFGLETEHRRLSRAITQIKHILVARSTNDSSPKINQALTNTCEQIVQNATRLKVAGQTSEFVENVLEKTKLGVRRGGLGEL